MPRKGNRRIDPPIRGDHPATNLICGKCGGVWCFGCGPWDKCPFKGCGSAAMKHEKECPCGAPIATARDLCWSCQAKAIEAERKEADL